MELQQGRCIKATALMDDPNFTGTLILITELNDAGAIGFMLNQPFRRKLNELEEFSSSKPFPLYTGGPVDQEHLFFIHQQPSLISDGELITGDLYVGGNFKQAVAAMNAGLLTETDLKIFVGYCGWNAGELEAEIAEGGWDVVEVGNVFDKL